MVKLNLGCGPKNIGQDYINIDAKDWDKNVDAICDFEKVPFSLEIKNEIKFLDDLELIEDRINAHKKFIKSNFADEIIMYECLEHLSFRKISIILAEIYRILKVGGVFKIQVPDCGKAMQAYVDKQVCDCVPHRPPNGIFKGNPKCPKCKGKAIMDWERWLFSFTGAGKHEFDFHKSVFTREILNKELEKARFTNIEFKSHPVKLKVECYK